MGCIEVKNKSEEILIQEAEHVLNLKKQKSIQVDSVIRKFSLNGQVTSVQLNRISSHLKLQTKNLFPFIKIDEFYGKLRDINGNYDLKDLLVIGILLSDGESSTKAGLLYQIFDEELTGHMSLSKVKNQLLYKLVIHSCSSLPKLVSPRQASNVNLEKIEKYSDCLIEKKDTCINSVAERLAVNGNDVTEITFTEVFRTFRQGKLTSSVGWRAFLYEKYLCENSKILVSTPAITESK
ncbi:hypothetical protein SteCoe_1715 [Stentor coeruleus]|uniref:Uncharacterized protein n=1 Tax=Stentor coeruleus TaxID=5963 RepID=A0A1R2D173_9CILI|nr:hypothetical protein SteCoe_1715 [Stentor coeruleus]